MPLRTMPEEVRYAGQVETTVVRAAMRCVVQNG